MGAWARGRKKTTLEVKTMRLTRAEFSVEDFRFLDEDLKIFLVQLGHLLNEINILRKCVLICSEKSERPDGVEKSAQVIQALFFIRMLAGKLYEGWGMVKRSYFNACLSKQYESGLSPEATRALDKLKQYFNKKSSVVKELRQKFAFHYDRQVVRECLAAGLEGSRLCILSGGTRPTDLFLFADDLINNCILKHVDPNCGQTAMDMLVKEVACDVADWFLEFGYGLMQELFKFRSIECCISEEEVREVKLDDADLPYFVVE